MQQRLGRRVFLKRSGLAAAGIPLLGSAGLALEATSEDDVDAYHVRIAETVKDEAWLLNLADPLDVIIARSGSGDLQCNSFLPGFVNIAELEQG